ncbi:MAG: DNA-processing protein DprA [Lachnospiraceae bacterium]|nr:DNA-processing protein DprA [Lachnospiraceae bacterium]MBP3569810.1 DNA-processing protein DprA [Lachnospiraceae bacterium]
MTECLEREQYWHWFHGLPGISQKEKEELLKICPKVKQWYDAAKRGAAGELLVAPYNETEQQKDRKNQMIEVLENQKHRDALNRSYEEARGKGISMVCRESEQYPERLKHIFLPPFMLYYYGKLPDKEKPSLAVIGARNCSVYGEEIAACFSGYLAKAGIQIVSGMARGIDGAAGRAAINEPGYAYAVLGSGVDVCYPKENKLLYTCLQEKGGVISEELPGTAPVSWNFPKRNRIISGLSDAVFVVEARENSGSLITVSYALEQGKEIYAVPGRLYEKLAEGTNRLIQEGAYLVREPEDILHGFSEKFAGVILKKSTKNHCFEKNVLASREKIVYACLSLRPKHIEELQEETGISLPELTSLLFDMEMKQYIKQPLKNYFIIQG